MNHLTLGIYSNGQYKFNVVRDEDLESHIEYNKTWRWGRLLYVDGKRVWNGCVKTECGSSVTCGNVSGDIDAGGSVRCRR